MHIAGKRLEIDRLDNNFRERVSPRMSKKE